MVNVTTVRTGEWAYYPAPCAPARHYAKGKSDPAFRMKPQITAVLIPGRPAPGSPVGRAAALAGRMVERPPPP
jgi:hypothetical protein